MVGTDTDGWANAGSDSKLHGLGRLSIVWCFLMMREDSFHHGVLFELLFDDALS